MFFSVVLISISAEWPVIKACATDAPGPVNKGSCDIGMNGCPYCDAFDPIGVCAGALAFIGPTPCCPTRVAFQGSDAIKGSLCPDGVACDGTPPGGTPTLDAKPW